MTVNVAEVVFQHVKQDIPSFFPFFSYSNQQFPRQPFFPRGASTARPALFLPDVLCGV